MSNVKKLPELLAPVGQVESFFAAMENGADAVYLGLKQLSARASATNFSLEDLSVLIPFAHKRNVAVYVALNSLVTAPELPAVMDLLRSLEDLGADALIVQDPGVLFLAGKYFPGIKLHASTLMTIHNSAGVNAMARLGVQRVVPARELTLPEIREIADRTTVELEIFVHGALCFSYSGLCLASSYRGGHSGLQGRCVQPCRLKFRQGHKEGFFLSCNDLCALPWIPELKKTRIAALKIEGRKKSADYIARVVKAYRLVLDASPKEEPAALAQAREWLSQSPSRRLTPGFFGDRPGEEVLVPGRSGFSGLWVGAVEEVRSKQMVVLLRHNLRTGDRRRPETGDDSEQDAFTVSEMRSESGASLGESPGGTRVVLPVRGRIKAGDRLFKVGSKLKSASSFWQEVRRDVPEGTPYARSFPNKDAVRESWPVAPTGGARGAETVFVKLDDARHLTRVLQTPNQNVILTASRSNLERIVKQRLSHEQRRRFTWSLPPLLTEKELDYYRPAVKWYVERGFTAWEANNWGHFDLVPRQDGVTVVAGHRFNLRNAAALAAMAENGCRWTVLSLEITRQELQDLSGGPLGASPIVPVYAWPALFTSRLVPKLPEDRPLATPRQEVYHFRKKRGISTIYADRPMNWFGQLPILREYGYRFFLIDLSDAPFDQSAHLDRIVNGFNRLRADEPFSLFNFERSPVPESKRDR